MVKCLHSEQLMMKTMFRNLGQTILKFIGLVKIVLVECAPLNDFLYIVVLFISQVLKLYSHQGVFCFVVFTFYLTFLLR